MIQVEESKLRRKAFEGFAGTTNATGLMELLGLS